jgi:hypothetical protein
VNCLKKRIVGLIGITIILSCLLPSIVYASAIIEKGGARGRGTIPISNPTIGYFRLRVRGQVNNHGSRVHGSLKFYVLKLEDTLKNPSLYLESESFESFDVDGDTITIEGTGTVEIGSETYPATFTLTVTDGDPSTDYFSLEITYNGDTETYEGIVTGDIIIR